MANYLRQRYQQHRKNQSTISQIWEPSVYNKIGHFPSMIHIVIHCVDRILILCFDFFRVEMLASSGYPHSPVYTYVCKVANIRCIATSSSKQGAKQSAALKMIEVIKGFQRKEEENQIDKTDAPMIKYYEVIKKQLPTYCPRVHDRLNYFFELPEEDREAARQILMDFFDTDKVITKDTVIKTCEALKLNYKIIDDECPPYHIFQLLGKHEIVIIEQLPVFYNRIIEFFITMLNVKEFDEHYILNNPDRCITGGASKKYRLLDDPYFSDDYIEY